MDCTSAAVGQNSSFVWLTFFFGGFLGAACVLAIERLLNLWIARKEREQIEIAIDIEIEASLNTCNQFLESYSKDSSYMGILAPIGTAWLDKYIEKCINFKNDDGSRLYTFLVAAKAYSKQIDTVETGLTTYIAVGRVNAKFKEGIADYNKTLVDRINLLMPALKAIRDIRSKNGITYDAVKNYFTEGNQNKNQY